MTALSCVYFLLCNVIYFAALMVLQNHDEEVPLHDLRRRGSASRFNKMLSCNIVTCRCVHIRIINETVCCRGFLRFCLYNSISDINSAGSPKSFKTCAYASGRTLLPTLLPTPKVEWETLSKSLILSAGLSERRSACACGATAATIATTPANILVMAFIRGLLCQVSAHYQAISHLTQI